MRRWCVLLSLALLFPVLAPPAAAVDWLSDHNDVGGTGSNPGETRIAPDNVGALAPVWSAPLGRRYGAAVVAQGTTFATTGYDPEGHDGGVVARDAGTGALRWFTGFGDGSLTGPRLSVAQQKVFATVIREVVDGAVRSVSAAVALDARSGRVVWRYPTQTTRAKVSVGGGRVYVSDMDETSALDAATGRLLWKVTTPTDFAVVPPVYGDGRLFVQDIHAGIAVYDAATGRLRALWGHLADRMAGDPVYAGGRLYTTGRLPVGPGDTSTDTTSDTGVVAAWDPACTRSCRPVWSRLLPTVSDLAVTDGLVVTGGVQDYRPSVVSALDRRNGAVVWQAHDTGYLGRLTTAGDVLYVSDGKGIRVLAYRLSGCGAPRCAPLSVLVPPQDQTPAGVGSEPRATVVDGTLFVTTTNGTLTAYRPTRLTAAPVTLDGPRTAYAPRGSRVVLTGSAAPGAHVDVLARGPGRTGFVDTRDLVADRGGRFSTSYVAVADLELFARSGALYSPRRSIGVGPTLGGPAVRVVARNRSTTVTGTAVPGSVVQLRFHREGRPAQDFSLRHVVRADTAGRWADTFRVDVDYVLLATRSDGSAPTRRVSISTEP